MRRRKTRVMTREELSQAYKSYERSGLLTIIVVGLAVVISMFSTTLPYEQMFKVDLGCAIAVSLVTWLDYHNTKKHDLYQDDMFDCFRLISTFIIPIMLIALLNS